MPEEKSQIIQIVIVGSIILVIVAAFIVSFIFFYSKRHNSHLTEKKEMESQFQQELLQTQLEIQEQTLKNISQEIHDNIGQALSLAKLNLNTMLPVNDQLLTEKIINSKEIVSKAIGDLRDLSRSLDTDYVKEMGLQRAIEYELELMQKTGTIKTSLQVEGAMIRLDKQKELILFRIIQESFHNIIKHAEASDIKVNIHYGTDVIELTITDNGKGVDLTLLKEGENNNFGLGIRNMHSRAKLIGADFNMNSTLTQGTTVRIVLPIINNNHENQ